MVSCKLFAQLGNQCFELSAAICHALRMNTTYAFPLRTTAPRIWRTYIHNLPELRPGQSTKHYYKEPGVEFNPIPEEQDITIEGYFQSEQYWYGYKEQLAEILGFKYTPADYVAIHVRRGDYLRFPDQFPVLPMEYYILSISKMLNLGYREFKIFSDDITWCKGMFQNDVRANFTFSEKKDPLTDMKDMFNASAFIIANSTFSLFPALLRTDNPIVIAPADDRWFGPAAKHLNSKDRMPERFIKI